MSRQGRGRRPGCRGSPLSAPRPPSPAQLASKQSYSGMKAILSELTKHMRTIDKGLEAARKANDEVFLNVIAPYAADATARLAQLDKDNEELTKGIAKVVTYLGEPADLVEKPEDGEACCGSRRGSRRDGAPPPPPHRLLRRPRCSLQHALEVHRGAAQGLGRLPPRARARGGASAQGSRRGGDQGQEGRRCGGEGREGREVSAFTSRGRPASVPLAVIWFCTGRLYCTYLIDCLFRKCGLRLLLDPSSRCRASVRAKLNSCVCVSVCV